MPQRFSSPAKRDFRGRTCILWFAAFLVLTQAVLIFAENCWPQVRDVQYAYKLRQLRAQINAAPDRPLVLLLGSSRTMCGLRPAEIAAAVPASQTPPLVFNFSASGGGPIKDGVYLRRLLDVGIRPDAVLIEILPVFLRQDDVSGEMCWLSEDETNQLTWREIQANGSLLRNADVLRSRWSTTLVTHPHLWRWLREPKFLRGMDAYGWMPWRAPASEEERSAETDKVRMAYATSLADFHVTDAADRSLRALLNLCCEEKIDFSLYLMPEGTHFRSWYGPAARAKIDGYLAGVSSEFGCAVHDATLWASDEQFFDSQHLLPDGAEIVSRRFGEEAFRPFLAELERRGNAALAKRRGGETR